MQLDEVVYTAANGVNVTVAMCLAGAYKLASSPLISTMAAEVDKIEQQVAQLSSAGVASAVLDALPPETKQNLSHGELKNALTKTLAPPPESQNAS